MKEIDFSSVIHELQPDDLPKPYSDFSRIIGIEATIRLSKEFGGTYQYFPKHRAATREMLRRLVPKDYFSGLGYKEIATKYDISETWVRQLVKEALKK